jgi:hypothetical protein
MSGERESTLDERATYNRPGEIEIFDKEGNRKDDSKSKDDDDSE